jgi:hypothetical protein
MPTKNNKWPDEYQNFQKLTPDQRLDLRKAFYSRYGHAKGEGYGFGNSELAFLAWEIKRGVLNEMDKSEQGSPWWRNVNTTFLIYSEWAGACFADDPDYESDHHCVNMWLEYLRYPTEQTWYRAHNASIITGYLDSLKPAQAEPLPERVFMNEVLYRLLFAQSLVESPDWIEELVADPRLPSVDLLVHLHDFYPIHYPLSKEDIKHILHQGYRLEEEAVRLLDEEIILPHLDRLYEEAAKWVGIPELTSFTYQGKADYALNRA